MNLEEGFSKLENHFGKENILIEYLVPEEIFDFDNIDIARAFSKSSNNSPPIRKSGCWHKI